MFSKFKTFVFTHKSVWITVAVLAGFGLAFIPTTIILGASHATNKAVHQSSFPAIFAFSFDAASVLLTFFFRKKISREVTRLGLGLTKQEFDKYRGATLEAFRTPAPAAKPAA